MSWWSKPASARFGAACLILLAMAAAPWLAAAARTRGIWLDEIWAIWLTRHDAPLGQVFAERWLYEPHPPLFSAITWLAGPLVGDDVVLRRGLNAIWIALYAATVIFVARRYPWTARFAVVFTALLAGSKFLASTFSEHRSYALAFWSSAAAVGLCYWAATLGRPLARRDAPAATALVVWTVVALNTHYFSTLITGLALAALAGTLAWRRQWRASALLVLAGALAAIPLVTGLALSLPRLATLSPGTWVRTTPLQATRLLASASLAVVFANLAAAGALAFVAVRTLRRAPPATSQPAPGACTFAGATVAAMALSVGALFAASLAKPLLVDRYLVSLAVLGAAAAAAVSADMLFARRWAMMALSANALTLLVIFSLRPLGETRWGDTAIVVGEMARRCPGTHVYAIDPSFVRTRFTGPAEIEAHDWGYAFVGRMYGFEVEVLKPGDGRQIRLSPACPTLIWGEHIGAPQAVLSALPRLPIATDPAVREALAVARVYIGSHGSKGFVVMAGAAR